MAFQFEVRAIRPWTRGGRNRRSGDPSKAAAPEAENLAAVLREYDSRVESRAMEARNEEEQRARFRVQAATLRDTVLVPTLQALGRQIREHGHRWEIETPVDILGQPTLVCTFHPRDTGGNAQSGSEIGFRFQYPDRLLVSGSTPEGGEIRGLPPRSYEIDAVDTAMVEEEVTRFVGRLLG